jgi:hypothetical protein
MTRFREFPLPVQTEIASNAVIQIVTWLHTCPFAMNSIPYNIIRHLTNFLTPILFLYTYGFLVFNDYEIIPPDNSGQVYDYNAIPQPSPLLLGLPPPPQVIGENEPLRDISNKENIGD